ncbi:uncharacterized protein LOC126826904 [Patella vulgata]|uniref:uncharacterized protein LOC126826904 n=1 Tax=Patella vulgata TaxID=6465 RepID=UPI0021808E0D|nr:uncharacterized protein LOC126826904 [Patella vulgata]
MEFSHLLAELKNASEEYGKQVSDNTSATAKFCQIVCRVADNFEKHIDKYENQVIGLWVIFGYITELYPQLEKGTTTQSLCQKLFGVSARIVLDVQWAQLDEDRPYKKNFGNTLTAFHELLLKTDGSSRFDVILALMDTHWTHPILGQVMSSEEDDEEGEGLKYICSEDPDILRLRVELMLQQNCEEFALNLCTWCLKHPELKSDLDIRQIQLTLMDKLHDLDRLQEEAEIIPADECVALVKRFLELPNQKKICTLLAQTFLVQNWIKSGNEKETIELLRMWIQHQYMVDQDEEKFISNSWAIAKLSRTTEQITLIIDCIREKCGDSLLQFYTDMCIYAINIDKGVLEKSMQSGDMSELQSHQQDMSLTCSKLADIFRNNSIRTARYSIVTAFSLNPSKKSLDKVASFYESDNQYKSQITKCCGNCTFDTGKCSQSDEKKEKINPATLYEVERLLNMLRPYNLKPDTDWKELGPACSKYLHERERIIALMEQAEAKKKEQPNQLSHQQLAASLREKLLITSGHNKLAQPNKPSLSPVKPTPKPELKIERSTVGYANNLQQVVENLQKRLGKSPTSTNMKSPSKVKPRTAQSVNLAHNAMLNLNSNVNSANMLPTASQILAIKKKSDAESIRLRTSQQIAATIQQTFLRNYEQQPQPQPCQKVVVRVQNHQQQNQQNKLTVVSPTGTYIRQPNMVKRTINYQTPHSTSAKPATIQCQSIRLVSSNQSSLSHQRQQPQQGNFSIQQHGQSLQEKHSQNIQSLQKVGYQRQVVQQQSQNTQQYHVSQASNEMVYTQQPGALLSTMPSASTSKTLSNTLLVDSRNVTNMLPGPTQIFKNKPTGSQLNIGSVGNQILHPQPLLSSPTIQSTSSDVNKAKMRPLSSSQVQLIARAKAQGYESGKALVRILQSQSVQNPVGIVHSQASPVQYQSSIQHATTTSANQQVISINQQQLASQQVAAFSQPQNMVQQPLISNPGGQTYTSNINHSVTMAPQLYQQSIPGINLGNLQNCQIKVSANQQASQPVLSSPMQTDLSTLLTAASTNARSSNHQTITSVPATCTSNIFPTLSSSPALLNQSSIQSDLNSIVPTIPHLDSHQFQDLQNQIQATQTQQHNIQTPNISAEQLQEELNKINRSTHQLSAHSSSQTQHTLNQKTSQTHRQGSMYNQLQKIPTTAQRVVQSVASNSRQEVTQNPSPKQVHIKQEFLQKNPMHLTSTSNKLSPSIKASTSTPFTQSSSLSLQKMLHQTAEKQKNPIQPVVKDIIQPHVDHSVALVDTSVDESVQAAEEQKNIFVKSLLNASDEILETLAALPETALISDLFQNANPGDELHIALSDNLEELGIEDVSSLLLNNSVESKPGVDCKPLNETEISSYRDSYQFPLNPKDSNYLAAQSLHDVQGIHIPELHQSFEQPAPEQSVVQVVPTQDIQNKVVTSTEDSFSPAMTAHAKSDESRVIMEKISNSKKSGSVFKCIICGAVFPSLDSLQYHVQRVCKSEGSVYNIDSIKPNDPKANYSGMNAKTIYQCVRCSSICISEREMQLHTKNCPKIAQNLLLSAVNTNSTRKAELPSILQSAKKEKLQLSSVAELVAKQKGEINKEKEHQLKKLQAQKVLQKQKELQIKKEKQAVKLAAKQAAKQKGPPPPQYKEMTSSSGKTFYKCELCGQTFCSPEGVHDHWLPCLAKNPLKKKKIKKKKLENDLTAKQSGVDPERITQIMTDIFHSVVGPSEDDKPIEVSHHYDKLAKENEASVEKEDSFPERDTDSLSTSNNTESENQLNGDKESEKDNEKDSLDCRETEKDNEKDSDDGGETDTTDSSRILRGRVSGGVQKPKYMFSSDSDEDLKRAKRLSKEEFSNSGTKVHSDVDKIRLKKSSTCLLCSVKLKDLGIKLQHFAVKHLKLHTHFKSCKGHKFTCHMCNVQFNVYKNYVFHLKKHENEILGRMVQKLSAEGVSKVASRRQQSVQMRLQMLAARKSIKKHLSPQKKYLPKNSGKEKSSLQTRGRPSKESDKQNEKLNRMGTRRTGVRVAHQQALNKIKNNANGFDILNTLADFNTDASSSSHSRSCSPVPLENAKRRTRSQRSASLVKNLKETTDDDSSQKDIYEKDGDTETEISQDSNDEVTLTDLEAEKVTDSETGTQEGSDQDYDPTQEHSDQDSQPSETQDSQQSETQDSQQSETQDSQQSETQDSQRSETQDSQQSEDSHQSETQDSQQFDDSEETQDSQNTQNSQNTQESTQLQDSQQNQTSFSPDSEDTKKEVKGSSFLTSYLSFLGDRSGACEPPVEIQERPLSIMQYRRSYFKHPKNKSTIPKQISRTRHSVEGPTIQDMLTKTTINSSKVKQSRRMSDSELLLQHSHLLENVELRVVLKKLPGSPQNTVNVKQFEADSNESGAGAVSQCSTSLFVNDQKEIKEVITLQKDPVRSIEADERKQSVMNESSECQTQQKGDKRLITSELGRPKPKTNKAEFEVLLMDETSPSQLISSFLQTETLKVIPPLSHRNEKEETHLKMHNNANEGVAGSKNTTKQEINATDMSTQIKFDRTQKTSLEGKYEKEITCSADISQVNMTSSKDVIIIDDDGDDDDDDDEDSNNNDHVIVGGSLTECVLMKASSSQDADGEQEQAISDIIIIEKNNEGPEAEICLDPEIIESTHVTAANFEIIQNDVKEVVEGATITVISDSVKLKSSPNKAKNITDNKDLCSNEGHPFILSNESSGKSQSMSKISDSGEVIACINFDNVSSVIIPVAEMKPENIIPEARHVLPKDEINAANANKMIERKLPEDVLHKTCLSVRNVDCGDIFRRTETNHEKIDEIPTEVNSSNGKYIAGSMESNLSEANNLIKDIEVCGLKAKYLHVSKKDKVSVDHNLPTTSEFNCKQEIKQSSATSREGWEEGCKDQVHDTGASVAVTDDVSIEQAADASNCIEDRELKSTLIPKATVSDSSHFISHGIRLTSATTSNFDSFNDDEFSEPEETINCLGDPSTNAQFDKITTTKITNVDDPKILSATAKSGNSNEINVDNQLLLDASVRTIPCETTSVCTNKILLAETIPREDEKLIKTTSESLSKDDRRSIKDTDMSLEVAGNSVDDKTKSDVSDKLRAVDSTNIDEQTLINSKFETMMTENTNLGDPSIINIESEDNLSVLNCNRYKTEFKDDVHIGTPKSINLDNKSLLDNKHDSMSTESIIQHDKATTTEKMNADQTETTVEAKKVITEEICVSPLVKATDVDSQIHHSKADSQSQTNICVEDQECDLMTMKNCDINQTGLNSEVSVGMNIAIIVNDQKDSKAITKRIGVDETMTKEDGVNSNNLTAKDVLTTNQSANSKTDEMRTNCDDEDYQSKLDTSTICVPKADNLSMVDQKVITGITKSLQVDQPVLNSEKINVEDRKTSNSDTIPMEGIKDDQSELCSKTNKLTAEIIDVCDQPLFNAVPNESSKSVHVVEDVTLSVNHGKVIYRKESDISNAQKDGPGVFESSQNDSSDKEKPILTSTESRNQQKELFVNSVSHSIEVLSSCTEVKSSPLPSALKLVDYSDSELGSEANETDVEEIASTISEPLCCNNKDNIFERNVTEISLEEPCTSKESESNKVDNPEQQSKPLVNQILNTDEVSTTSPQLTNKTSITYNSQTVLNSSVNSISGEQYSASTSLSKDTSSESEFSESEQSTGLHLESSKHSGNKVELEVKKKSTVKITTPAETSSSEDILPDSDDSASPMLKSKPGTNSLTQSKMLTIKESVSSSESSLSDSGINEIPIRKTQFNHPGSKIEHAAGEPMTKISAIQESVSPENKPSALVTTRPSVSTNCQSQLPMKNATTTESEGGNKDRAKGDAAAMASSSGDTSPEVGKRSGLIHSLREQIKPESFSWDLDSDEDEKRKEKNERSCQALRSKAVGTPFTWDESDDEQSKISALKNIKPLHTTQVIQPVSRTTIASCLPQELKFENVSSSSKRKQITPLVSKNPISQHKTTQISTGDFTVVPTPLKVSCSSVPTLNYVPAAMTDTKPTTVSLKTGIVTTPQKAIKVIKNQKTEKEMENDTVSQTEKATVCQIIGTVSQKAEKVTIPPKTEMVTVNQKTEKIAVSEKTEKLEVPPTTEKLTAEQKIEKVAVTQKNQKVQAQTQTRKCLTRSSSRTPSVSERQRSRRVTPSKYRRTSPTKSISPQKKTVLPHISKDSVKSVACVMKNKSTSQKNQGIKRPAPLKREEDILKRKVNKISNSDDGQARPIRSQTESEQFQSVVVIPNKRIKRDSGERDIQSSCDTSPESKLHSTTPESSCDMAESDSLSPIRRSKRRLERLHRKLCCDNDNHDIVKRHKSNDSKCHHGPSSTCSSCSQDNKQKSPLRAVVRRSSNYRRHSHQHLKEVPIPEKKPEQTKSITMIRVEKDLSVKDVQNFPKGKCKQNLVAIYSGESSQQIDQQDSKWKFRPRNKNKKYPFSFTRARDKSD